MRCLWCGLDFESKKVIIEGMKNPNFALSFVFAFSLFSSTFGAMPVHAAESTEGIIKAITDNNFDQLLTYKKAHPWIQDYLVKLLKTDLEFASSIKDSKQKLELLEQIYKKTSFVPTKIQILKEIAKLQKDLKLSDKKTQNIIAELTAPVADPKDCKAYLRKGSNFRDLRDFEQSLFHFQAALDCYDNIDYKVRALKEITLTHKVKYRGEDFLKASLDTYNFAKENFNKNKLSAKEFNKIGIEHVRAVWTYKNAKAGLVYLDEIKKLLKSNYSLQTVYWIYARIAEEQKKIKDSQKYLALALKEKPLMDEDLIAIYWQKFWNHLELKQHQEAVDALKASLSVGDPDEGQSRTLYWLVEILEDKKSKLEKDFKKLTTKKNSKEQINKAEVELTELAAEIQNFKDTLMTKYPISFYTALIQKKNNYKYAPSDLEDLNSESYKKLPKNFDLAFYKELHQSSTLATQSFLSKYYYQNRRKISKDQRFLVKRLMARNGETTELFIELEARPEICLNNGSPCMDLFPKPYETQVVAAAKRYKVPAEIIYSIIRQESIFNPLAKSWADARGLMQLLPSLAHEISKKAGVEYTGPLDLYSVEKNISYGAYLIKSLIEEMNNSLVLGLSGYNAEKGRAKVWYKTRFKKDWLKFIEEIPYQETRNYNKLVLRNFLIYSNNDDSILKPWFPEGIID